MKPIQILFTGLLLASLLPGCEIHDDIDVDVKRKAIVYLRYNYNDGEHDTMDEVQTLRLFFFDLKTGRQYRDTTLTRDEFLTDTGAMQTYISNGEYGIVTLANVGHGSTVSADNIRDATITFPDTGADPLFFNRIQTPIQKGDSLRFDIDLFKSVYKVNVLVEGMQNLDDPEEFYFGLDNRAGLTFGNVPCGDREDVRVVLHPLFPERRTDRLGDLLRRPCVHIRTYPVQGHHTALHGDQARHRPRRRDRHTHYPERLGCNDRHLRLGRDNRPGRALRGLKLNNNSKNPF